MDKHQVEALDRRNKAETRLIMQKLDSICEVVQENHRALRGHNGDAGLVADVRDLQKSGARANKIYMALVVAALAVIGDFILHLL